MTRQYRAYSDFLLEKLRDPQRALAYLNEAFNDEDQRVFLLALKNVLEAQGGDITSVAQAANLSRQNLYKVLSPKGNPKLTSLRSVLHALGFELAIQPFEHK
ncbi:MAG: putative addiction module antidote protein [Candidatus Dependentiae bacterium]|nr:putative addiction module antidote protein [Candidatus Dependentiae bacterium]